MNNLSRVGIDITAQDKSGPAFQSAMAKLNAVTRTAGDATNRMRNMSFQMNDVMVSLAGGMNPLMVMAQQGPQMAQIYGFGQGGVAQAFKDIGSMITGIATRFAPVLAVVGLGAAAFAGLTYAINQGTSEAYTMGEVFAATMDVITDSITASVMPAVAELSPFVKTVLDSVVGFFKGWGNVIVRVNVMWFEVVKRAVGALPEAFKHFGGMAADFFIGAIEGMVNRAIGLINSFLALANSAFASLPEALQPGKIELLQKVDFKQYKFNDGQGPGNPFEGLLGRFGEIAGTDYLGVFADKLEQKLVANRKAADKKGDDVVKKLRDAVKKTGAANDNARDKPHSEILGFGFDGLQDQIAPLQDAIDALKGSLQGMFDSALDGSFNLQKSLNSLLRTVASRSFSSFLDGLFGMLQGGLNTPGGGLYGGGLGGFLSGLFGGFRADGGPVRSNKAYIVGENGPELFSPGQGGYVTPNHAIMGGGGSNVTIIDQRRNAPAIEKQDDGRGNVRLLIRDEVNRTVSSGAADGAYQARFGSKPSRIRR